MKKSVLFIIQNLPAPQDRRVWLEAKTLEKEGFSVSVISPGKSDQKKFEEIEGISIWRYGKAPEGFGFLNYAIEYGWSFLATFWLSFRVYFKKGFSVIHTANPPDIFFLVGIFWKIFGVKFIYDQHDLSPEMLLAKFGKNPKSFLYKLLVFLERASYRFCDAHIATCQSGLERTLSRNFDEKKSFVVRSAPDEKVFSKSLASEEIFREARSKFKYLACYLGVMGSQDGVDKLLLSIKIIVLDQKRSDVGFVLMGDGDDFSRLKKQTEEMGISKNVIFTGWADAKTISSYFSVSDLALMPEPKNEYTDNSLHNKILEYMSFGLPIVSYDLKEARKTASEAAVFAKDNDEEEFSRLVLELLDEEEKRKKMGEAGKDRMEKFFRWKFSRKELLRTYDFVFRRGEFLKKAFLVWAPEVKLSEFLAREIGADLIVSVRKKWKGHAIPALFRYIIQGIDSYGKLRKIRPGLIFVQNPPLPAVILTYIYCLFNKRTRFAIDTHTAGFLDRKWVIFHPIHKFLAKRAVLNTAHNYKNLEFLEKWGIENFRVLQFYTPKKEELILEKNNILSERISRRLSNHNGLNVFMVNRFANDDAWEEVVEAARLAKEANFFLTGDFEKISIEKRKTFPANVVLTGYVSHQEFMQLMQKCDVVLALTKRKDTVLWSVREIMAMEKPFVVTDNEVLRHYFSEVAVFSRNDKKELREKIEEAWKNRFETKGKIVAFLEKDKKRWENDMRYLEEIFSKI